MTSGAPETEILNVMASLNLLVEGQYIRIILSTNFSGFSCILILIGGLDI